jgi:hypothetical protein
VRNLPVVNYTCSLSVYLRSKVCSYTQPNGLWYVLLKYLMCGILLDQNSLANEMRTRGNERVSVRQGYDYGCRYGTLNEANLIKTARTCCSLEA